RVPRIAPLLPFPAELEHPRPTDPRQDPQLERWRPQPVAVPPEHVPYGPLGHPPVGRQQQRGLVYVTRVATDSIALVDLESHRVTASFKVGNGPYDVAFNAAGSSAYVTNLYDHTVGVINTLTQTQVTTFPVAGGAVRVLLGPDETKLYVTLDNGGLTVLNSTSGTVDTTIQLGSVALNGVALTSDRSRLYVSSVGGTVTEIN